MSDGAKVQYISAQPKATLNDPLFTDKLNAVSRFQITQGRLALEALTGGAWPNTYIISDMDRPTAVAGREMDVVNTPLFVVKEESGCLGRLCCPGNQSFTAKVVHVSPQPTAGDTHCGCYTGHKYTPDLSRPSAMTLQREGCCGKWLGCFVCCQCCQNDMAMHGGDVSIAADAPPEQSSTYFGRSIVPIGGGGCAPVINLFSTGSDAPFCVVNGPALYGGWLSVCTTTQFTFSSPGGERGDIGVLNKKKAKDCGEVCKQICTNVDDYEFLAGPNFKGLTTEQRATILGNLIHIEYIFFENDVSPCYVTDDNTVYCTLCQMYCCGCACPIQVCFSLNSN